MRRRVLVCASVLALALAGCGDESTGSPPGSDTQADAAADAAPDAGGEDTGAGDATTEDTGSADSGSDDTGTPDVGSPDAGTPDAADPDAGGADGGVFEDLPTELPLSVTVDTTIEPSVETWPALDGGAPRPVAGIAGPGGRTSTFVSNELILSYTDAAERDAFVARWSGELVLDLNPADYGVTDLPKMALVRTDAAAADVQELIPAVRQLEPAGSGDYAVSSEAGLKLLTAAMTESAAGQKVSVNWIGESDGYVDRQLAESPTSLISGYDPNPFTWNYLRRGGTQDIGVTEAWRALELEGKLGNRVRIAILDGGFAPDDDFPANTISDSVIAGTAPTGSTNPGKCGGGSTCDYHGTSVLHTAAGVPDNGFGTAGTGGPVADAMSIVTLADTFTSTAAMLVASANDADIINMSFRMTVPSILAVTVVAQELASISMSSKGIMIFGAAGNEGENVDSETCFTLCVPIIVVPYCWEECFETYYHAPCENTGVECVGGLAVNSRSRATNSNFGKESVDIFAPYTVFVGPAPDNMDPLHTINGTSFSTPYMAGVAALVKAADPTLTGKEVLKILHDTANGSSDPQVGRYVNAFDAVHAALGDIRPTLRIVAPADGTTMGALALEGFTLVATSEDYEDGVDSIDVVWESDLDGPLGSGHVRQALFTTSGTRTITATGTDSAGRVATASVTITVENEKPKVAITTPANSNGVVAGVPFVAAASTWDPESFSSLPCENISWEVEDSTTKEVVVYPGECSPVITVAKAGFHNLTVRGKDAEGAEASDSLVMVVTSLPASGPPFVSLVAPVNGILVEPNVTLELVGTAIDPDDQAGSFPLVYEWTAKVGNGTPVVIGTSPIVDWKPNTIVQSGCGDKAVELTLKVTDGGGEVTTKKVTVYVFFPSC